MMIMQYETIILELLSRIKKLEDDVSLLKQTQEHMLTVISSTQGDTNINDKQNSTAVSYTKVSDEMIHMCYQYGKNIQNGEIVLELADKICQKTSMNHSSAVIYLYAVNAMMEGKVYKRAISGKAIRRYFDMIMNEYGSNGLKKAIKAVRLHVDYRRSFGQIVDSIETVCDEYEAKI